ncbi:hypothetical protein JQ609_02005 [Bradyrhizobium sp. AUGA SZCCT0169]|uniref:hypothetical protein n=1 Tax=Bradyrhizobium sp. AUGA SZCCT0169 TaxID=2807663 RepID=UPI001BA47B37|nr:hypothetical protein [Bradyrhizobium sp. AUGA SZCCT0169]MBR1245698.1 hypothetical protein [Bradyrhizobium sp. AUGA SZCCT0169]
MGRTVILSDGSNTVSDIASASRNNSDTTPFAQKTMQRTGRQLPAPGRSAPLWMAAAMLAITWASETQACSDREQPLADAQHVTVARNLDSVGTEGDGDSVALSVALPPSRAGNDRSVQVVQATIGDTRQSPEQELHWAESLSRELTNARRDIELLQRLEQGRDRAEWLEQSLAAARRDVETQSALAAKAVEETARMRQAAPGGAAELQNSLQQARELAERLEQDLAAARRDVGTQTALAAKAGEEASRSKQAGESIAAELQKSLQQERERSARLEQDLATVRHEVETQTALATKAGEETSRLKAAEESGAAELQKSLHQERERSARLERDLAASRGDVETQAALAAKASEEVLRRKQAAEAGAAELKQSRARADALAQDLSLTRSAIYAYEAQARKAGDEAAELRQAAANGAPSTGKAAPDERERFSRLEQDLAVARRDVEAQAALAAKAGEEAFRLKQERESGAAELQKARQQERERSTRLEQELAAARRDVETQTALATKASEETSRLKQERESGAAELQKARQQERERSARLEQELAAARREVETQSALATKAGEETSRLKAAGESGAAELQKARQQERERSTRLEQELVAARREVETQTALATKAGEETSRLKAAGESGAAELQKSRQQERERSVRLEQELAAARREVEAQTALAAKAGAEASRLKAAAESGVAELQKALQQERERSARLEQDIAAARRDIETQTALAAKAGEEASRRKQGTVASAAESRRSMQKEHQTADLPADLSMTRSAIYAYRAQARKAGDEAAEVREAAANGASLHRKSAQERERPAWLQQDLVTARAERAPAAPARGDAQLDPEQAAVATGLVARAAALLRQGDIGAARLVLERAVEMGSAQASFALAETYDPLILAKWKTQGTRGDASKAQGLYARADAAGIQEAKARLEALRR